MKLVGIILSLMSINATGETVTMEGYVTTYKLTDQHDFSSDLHGYSFNPYWGFTVNKHSHCGNDERCLAETIKNSKCIVETQTEMNLPDSGKVEIRLDFQATFMEYVQNVNYAQDHQVFLVKMLIESGGRVYEERRSIHTSDLNFQHFALENDRIKRIVTTRDYLAPTVLEGVSNSNMAHLVRYLLI